MAELASQHALSKDKGCRGRAIELLQSVQTIVCPCKLMDWPAGSSTRWSPSWCLEIRIKPSIIIPCLCVWHWRSSTNSWLVPIALYRVWLPIRRCIPIARSCICITSLITMTILLTSLVLPCLWTISDFADILDPLHFINSLEAFELSAILLIFSILSTLWIVSIHNRSKILSVLQAMLEIHNFDWRDCASGIVMVDVKICNYDELLSQ